MTPLKITDKARASIVSIIRKRQSEESRAGNDTSNDLDEQHRFACRYAATILAGLARDMEDGRFGF